MAPDIRKSLGKFAPHFIEARESGLNEADTVMRLCKFFEDVLGYDSLEDISREANLKSKFVDVCLKVDGATRVLVEAKAAGQALRERHIEQAQRYASENNFQWVLLSNGVDWHLYHLTFDDGIEYVRAFNVSLDGEDALELAAENLSLLHKQSVRRGELEEFWERHSALSAESIGRALFSEGALNLIRREIRRDTGLLIDPEDLGHAIHKLLSQDARELLGPMRIRRRRRPAKKAQGSSEGAGPSGPSVPPESKSGVPDPKPA